MNILDAAQRRSMRAMQQMRLERDAHETERVARGAAHTSLACALGEASKRDAVRAKLATAQARLEVLERMLRDVGAAQKRYEVAAVIVATNYGPGTMEARAEALGVLLARVDVAVRVACQTPVVKEKA